MKEKLKSVEQTKGNSRKEFIHRLWYRVHRLPLDDVVRRGGQRPPVKQKKSQLEKKGKANKGKDKNKNGSKGDIPESRKLKLEKEPRTSSVNDKYESKNGNKGDTPERKLALEKERKTSNGKDENKNERLVPQSSVQDELIRRLS